MKKRIFLGTFIVACAALLLASLCAAASFYAATLSRAEAENAALADALADAMNEGERAPDLRDLYRVTLVAADGAIRFDSVADASRMENHAQRPEIIQALASGAGRARRNSETLGEESLYEARRLQNGDVLRIARTQRSLLGLLSDLRLALWGALALLVLLSAVLSGALSRRIARPLLTLDLDRPERGVAYPELAPLLARMASQKKRLDAQLSQMAWQAEETRAMMRNMREGLVLLDAQGRVLSLNESARRLLLLSDRDYAGQPLYTLCRDPALLSLIRKTADAQAAETRMTVKDRVLQARLSTVEQAGETHGRVLLLLDVTDKDGAERMRREFTANVSHELKTPLTSISGYAELMRDGFAKPEDTPLLAGKIYAEAQRMIALVVDILRLSKLDEGQAGFVAEPLELTPLIREVLDALQPETLRNRVTLSFSGQGATVFAPRQIVWEMLYNVIDNAIDYNVPDGQVWVTADGLRVSVRDTGIGIPASAREKVFERFYRVDKSRSKTTGGTGLGLSIVKHGAAYIGATVRLTSEVGKGTQVDLIFPEMGVLPGKPPA